MAYHHSINTDMSKVLFNPVFEVYSRSNKKYDCASISDIHFCQLGVIRCISSSKTGQEFLQYHADKDEADIEPSLFFKALKSPRRLKNLTSINDLLAEQLNKATTDPLAKFEELENWDIHLVDGHYQKAACFDPIHQSSNGKTKKTATGHFFRMNLRNSHLSLLDMARPKDGKKKAHDITVIKRSTADTLRYGAAKGRKVMLVWDKACIDYREWYRLKSSYGIYFVTMEKTNSKARNISGNLVDRTDKRNAGVVSDHLVSTSCGVQLRRIIYTNPEDGKTYRYLTNDMTLPAGLIVLFYKHRWDEEKVFHQFKSKMEERKSWASSDEAKQAHATFECLAHNLLLLCEEHMIREEGLTDQREIKKSAGRKPKQKRDKIAQVNMVNTAITRASQRTQRFIRWVRARIYMHVPWSQTVKRLRIIWSC